MPPTTLLPFLYQTRTLQLFTRTRVTTPALQAFFHASPRQNLPRLTRSAASEGQPEKKFRKSRGVADASIDNSVPFEGLVFEEEDDPEVLRRSTITVKERDAFDRIFEEIAMRGRVPAQPLENNRLPGSTGLFLPDLFPGQQKQQQEQDHQYNESDKAADQPKTSAQISREYINVIVRDAESQASSKDSNFMRHHMLGRVKTTSDPERALMRFPPSLRKAAKLALGVMDMDRTQDDYSALIQTIPTDIPQDSGTKLQLDALDEIANNKLSDKIAAESIRSVERKRVEDLMRAAKTDFQLWDVLEKEVFSMVEKLGISGEPKNFNMAAAGKKRRGAKPKDVTVPEVFSEDAENEAAVAALGEVPDGKLSMNIYGPLYPSYLLYALRLMDSAFAHPSPMALNLLPRIKELGLMSFVLGVSSPFYNTLARILWYRYGDAKAVLDLLEEMRHVGLYCDGSTQGVIYRIQEYIKDCKSGMHGPFVAEVVDGFDYEFTLKSRLNQWNFFIGKQLEEGRADFEPGMKLGLE